MVSKKMVKQVCIRGETLSDEVKRRWKKTRRKKEKKLTGKKSDNGRKK